jgi:phosphatidate cytidylyltransferase
MTAEQQSLVLFIGIGAFLALATIVGLVLRRRFGEGNAKDAIANLNARIWAWWVMVIAVGAALFAGRTAVIALFGLVSFAALREAITATPRHPGDRQALIASFVLVVPLQYVLIGIDWYGLFSILIPVYAFLFLPILSALSGDTRNFLARTAETQWALMIGVYCISHVPALLTLRIPGYEGRNVLLMIFLVLVVQSSDVLQYIWGKALGKHKVAPELSPSKTVEGFVGGVVTATALGAALWWITPFEPVVAGIMALVITIMGFLGGLVMSAIKRDLGVKDWGSVIRGHGGMLDRLDSVCFSAPIFFHLTRYFFTP